MSSSNSQNLRKDLEEKGYCVVRDLLPQDLIGNLQSKATQILPTVSEEHRERNRSQGCLVQLADYPAFSEIIGAPQLREAFSGLAFSDPRFSSGYLISKPPKSPALFWHQDWWGWDDNLSYTDKIAQVFVMIYLTDTSVDNGCLRVIPASHRNYHPLHDSIQAHDEALSRVIEPAHPLYHAHTDAVAVPVKTGDVIIGDARLIHGSYSNNSEENRSLITLWYHPDYQSLPEPIRASIRKIYDRTIGDTASIGQGARTMDDWPVSEFEKIENLLVPPITTTNSQNWNRIPHWDR